VILGNSFFENYYVIWDFDAMTLGFNGFTEQLPTPDPPIPHHHSKFPAWAIALLVIVGLGALTVIGWLLY
jgi:hypothetical protein